MYTLILVAFVGTSQTVITEETYPSLSACRAAQHRKESSTRYGYCEKVK